MPGSSSPSRNSSEAPPPVEMWVILSAKPRLLHRCGRVAAADDGDGARIPRRPRPGRCVPACEGRPLRNTPIGPFQTTVPAPFIGIGEERAGSWRRCPGPSSRPRYSRRSTPWCRSYSRRTRLHDDVVHGQQEVYALGSSAFAEDVAVPAPPCRSRRVRGADGGCPWAALKVYAIPPPMIRVSHLVDQVGDDADLVGDLGAAEDGDERAAAGSARAPCP